MLGGRHKPAHRPKSRSPEVPKSAAAASVSWTAAAMLNPKSRFLLPGPSKILGATPPASRRQCPISTMHRKKVRAVLCMTQCVRTHCQSCSSQNACVMTQRKHVICRIPGFLDVSCKINMKLAFPKVMIESPHQTSPSLRPWENVAGRCTWKALPKSKGKQPAWVVG